MTISSGKVTLKRFSTGAKWHDSIAYYNDTFCIAEEFLKKLAPCIERGDLDASVEEEARVAREVGVGAGEFLIFFNAGVGTKNIGKNNLSDLHNKRAIEGYKKKESNKTYREIIQIVYEYKAG